MRAYPRLKRLAVLAARDRGMNTTDVAAKYGVSKSWVRRVVQHRRQFAKYGPYKMRRRNRHGGTPAQRIKIMVREEPRLRISELQRVLGVKLDAELLNQVKFDLDLAYGIRWYGGMCSELVASPTGDFTFHYPTVYFPSGLERELEALSKGA